MKSSTLESHSRVLIGDIDREMREYADQIRKFRREEIGEVKMQKYRLQFGTYAQRQEGVQMQRIKLPGGFLTASQLTRLADAADEFASGFIHFTTRQAAQLYYLELDEAPDLMRFLAEEGITTREACGNTVRNVTTCYRSGVSATEPFVVQNYAQALVRYLLRNNYNQTMGRKVKIAFEGCSEDHSGMRFHDLGFWATTREENGELKRGFRVYIGGGLGSNPHLGHLYTDFLPVEELLTFSTAVIRIFDRYGERKKRMKARMKFLVNKLGWEKYVELLEKEINQIEKVPLDEYYVDVPAPVSTNGIAKADETPGNGAVSDPDYRTWLRESTIAHRHQSYRGVQVRLKLGDITANRARELAKVAERYSEGQLRTTIEQNLFLPWVKVNELTELYEELARIGFVEKGTETIMDVTACPGADTCRLGIASAKGLGSAISEAFEGPLADYRDFADSMRIKISGCPNGCAQHNSAHIGFHAAAFTKDGRNIPAHLLFLGGQMQGDDTRYGNVIGKYPAKHCVSVVKQLLDFYREKRQNGEEFNDFVERMGTDAFKELLQDLRDAPSYEEDPSFYADYRHGNEEFSVRKGVKGECAGTTIGEQVPEMQDARDRLSQAEAYLYHKEFSNAAGEAYEAAADAVRVPLYDRLVDPFSAEESIWKFENLFVLSGESEGEWTELTSELNGLKEAGDEESARALIEKARALIDYCDNL